MALIPNSKTSALFHLLLFLLGNVAYATVFTLENHCSYTVWPGTLSGNGAALLGEGGFALAPGSAVQLTAPAGWSGRFWARTGCSFDASGSGKCVTGDCGSGLKCSGGGYCCTGDHNTPQTCPPTHYSEIFKNACPTAYSYAYDDASSTCTCSGSDYRITFCST
ncbi:Pathogenesis-related protein 5 [Glycine soja]|nr:Pathogenesis-related protein 5 [Glycine soja]